MAIPRQITMPVIRPERPPADIPGLVDRGLVVKTNRTNQGSWSEYLDGLRRAPRGISEIKNEYERPGERNPRLDGPKHLPRNQGVSRNISPASNPKSGRTRSGASASYGAGQTSPAGQNTANYAAGLRRYGASSRSAPNVGPVRNKAGYNERDRKAARANGANLATGDELNRVRLLGG